MQTNLETWFRETIENRLLPHFAITRGTVAQRTWYVWRKQLVAYFWNRAMLIKVGNSVWWRRTKRTLDKRVHAKQASQLEAIDWTENQKIFIRFSWVALVITKYLHTRSLGFWLTSSCFHKRHFAKAESPWRNWLWIALHICRIREFHEVRMKRTTELTLI